MLFYNCGKLQKLRKGGQKFAIFVQKFCANMFQDNRFLVPIFTYNCVKLLKLRKEYQKFAIFTETFCANILSGNRFAESIEPLILTYAFGQTLNGTNNGRNLTANAEQLHVFRRMIGPVEIYTIIIALSAKRCR